jgi:hypothetical protein
VQGASYHNKYCVKISGLKVKWDIKLHFQHIKHLEWICFKYNIIIFIFCVSFKIVSSCEPPAGFIALIKQGKDDINLGNFQHRCLLNSPRILRKKKTKKKAKKKKNNNNNKTNRKTQNTSHFRAETHCFCSDVRVFISKWT